MGTMELSHHRQAQLLSAERKLMDGKKPVKTQNLKVRNLESGDSPQELAEEDARQVVGGLFNFDGILGDKYASKKSDPSLLLDR